MSVSLFVFLPMKRMPSPVAWAKAIRDSGFPMELDADFDPESHAGYLPCQYDGEPAGFELYMDTVDEYREDGGDELPEEFWTQIGDRDAMVSFVTHSVFRELMTSVIAAGVLASMSDGLLLDAQSGEMVRAEDALAWSRRSEAEIQPDLQHDRQS